MSNIELTSTTPPKRLVYITSDRSDDYREQQNDKVGIPDYYTIEGTSIQLLPTPDATYTLQLNYFQDIPALAALADSGNNWLLLAHPDVYLYATLQIASPYLMDLPTAQAWDALYARSMQELQMSDEKSRYSGGTLNMRPKYVYT